MKNQKPTGGGEVSNNPKGRTNNSVKKNNTYQQVVEPHEKRKSKMTAASHVMVRRSRLTFFPSQLKVGAESASWDMIPTWCIANEFFLFHQTAEKTLIQNDHLVLLPVLASGAPAWIPMNLSVGWANIYVSFGWANAALHYRKGGKIPPPSLEGKKLRETKII